MKAVRLVKTGTPLQMQDLPRPEPGPRDLLVRVKAAGICHSDAHYRSGVSPANPLPLTLGHEIAGLVEQAGSEVQHFKPGDRVCLHYMTTCGHCPWCDAGSEQFCRTGKMIGKHRDGGYAEWIAVPERAAFHLPDEIPFAAGAIMMCSSATALHALRKTRLRAGERVAVYGIGGLGISAVQLAHAFGASTVFAVDINPAKLELATHFGAIPINASVHDPVKEIMRLGAGRGVDVALELIGLPQTMRQAVQSLGVMGRAGLAGLTGKSFEIAPYAELLNKEAEIIGISDHLAREIPLLLEWARAGKLLFDRRILRMVPLDAEIINQVLDGLETFGSDMRVVVTP
jgi:2-desacetyl-2-hydroxyethyl bacteriochlorophyllide A dehydrogenase